MIRISRIRDIVKRTGARFLERVFTQTEIGICKARKFGEMESLSARYAAKEAAAKALGTGIWTRGIRFTDFEIVSDDHGKPLLNLYGQAAAIFSEKGGEDIDISLSHDGDMAIAMCVMIFNPSGYKRMMT